MNTPVSFPIAKLLKEKGFDEVCQQWYSVEGGLYYQDEFDNSRGSIPVYECEAPTIAEVVMWLYEKHGIWIKADTFHTNKTLFQGVYQILRQASYPDKVNTLRIGAFNSPTKAYEAAIAYTLNNLI